MSAAEPADFAHWPLPIGRVQASGGLTYLYSSEPGGFSAEEFRRIPDGRAELLDGVVRVRPGLTAGQQQAIDNLYAALCVQCPKGLVPSNGNLDMQIGEATIFRPDIQVLTRAGADAPRVLVAEVVPGRGHRHCQADRVGKLRGFRDAGVVTYWAVDPDEPSVAVYDIQYTAQGPGSGDSAGTRGQRYWWRVWAWAVCPR